MFLHGRFQLIEFGWLPAFVHQSCSCGFNNLGDINLRKAPCKTVTAFETLIQNLNTSLIQGTNAFLVMMDK
jgi:hypothetical protein